MLEKETDLDQRRWHFDDELRAVLGLEGVPVTIAPTTL